MNAREDHAGGHGTPVLLVTGASSGIGAALARLGAAAGYRVCVHYHSGEARARAVVDAIVAAGGIAMAAGADVADENEVARLFDAVDGTLGTVTALVNNAAIIGGDYRVDEARQSDLDRIFAVNVTGCFLCAREAIRRMSTRRGGRGGAIVNVSSLSARNGGRDARVHYAASKAALLAFTSGLARQVADEGIRVNTLVPGPTDTPIHDPFGGAERVAAIASTVPMSRAGRPEEVARAALWLLGDEASYVTGAHLDVNGGA